MQNFAEIAEPKSALAKSVAARAEGKSGGIKELAEGRVDLHKINPYLLKVEDGFNVRDFSSERMIARVDELAQSISEVGLKRPLKVRMKGGVPVLVDGECRLRAVFRAIDVYGAEIRTVKIELTDKNMSDADATLGIAVENDTLELTALERGMVFKRLESYGWSIADIAAKVGKTAPHVTSMIELTNVPDALKALIRDGSIAPTLALSIAKDSDFDEAKIMTKVGAAQDVVAAKGRKRVTAKAVETVVRSSLRDKIVDVLEAAEIAEDAGGEDDTVVMITLSSEQAAILGKLLKFHVGAPLAE